MHHGSVVQLMLAEGTQRTNQNLGIIRDSLNGHQASFSHPHSQVSPQLFVAYCCTLYETELHLNHSASNATLDVRLMKAWISTGELGGHSSILFLRDGSFPGSSPAFCCILTMCRELPPRSTRDQHEVWRPRNEAKCDVSATQWPSRGGCS